MKKIKDTQGKETLEALDHVKEEEAKKIAEILLTYQWPMNIMTASQFTPDAKEALLQPKKDSPYSAQQFIQNKIREALKSDAYVVIFIPTALYELFCIHHFLQTIDTKNPLTKAALHLITGNSGKPLAINLTSLLNDTKKSATEIRNKVFEEYKKVNNIFFVDFESPFAFLYMNNVIGHALLKKFPNFKEVNLFERSPELPQEKSQALVPELVKEIMSEAPNVKKQEEFIPKLWHCLGSFKPLLEKEHKLQIISKIIALEYEAAHKNMGLLIRGTMFEEKPVGFEDKPQKSRLAGTTITRKGTDVYGANLYSVSFGNSLFGGFFMDYNACAYYYLSDEQTTKAYLRATGYVLFIDKKAYIEHQNQNLFFIAPLSPIASVFASGEYFHSRSKVAVGKKTGLPLRIRGLFGEEIADPTAVILITRDTAKHAELFSKFLAQYGKIIQIGDEQDFTQEEREFVKKSLEYQQQAGKFYRTAQTVERARKKFVGKLKHGSQTEQEKKAQKEIKALLAQAKKLLQSQELSKHGLYEDVYNTITRALGHMKKLEATSYSDTEVLVDDLRNVGASLSKLTKEDASKEEARIKLLDEIDAIEDKNELRNKKA